MTNGPSKLPPDLKRAITQFDNAAQDYAFRGTIPRYESIEAEIAYDEVVYRYERARQLLERAIRRYAGK